MLAMRLPTEQMHRGVTPPKSVTHLRHPLPSPEPLPRREHDANKTGPTRALVLTCPWLQVREACQLLFKRTAPACASPAITMAKVGATQPRRHSRTRRNMGLRVPPGCPREETN